MGRDFVKHGVGIAMRGKPGFRGGAIVGEIKELGTFVGTIENANHSRLRPLDDYERQRRVHGKRLARLEHHIASAAEVALCSVTLAGIVALPTVRAATLRTRRPPLLLFSQAESFLLNRSGGRGVPSE
jgi:hypothetical protein